MIRFSLQAKPKVEKLRFATAKSSEDAKIAVVVGYLRSQDPDGVHAVRHDSGKSPRPRNEESSHPWHSTVRHVSPNTLTAAAVVVVAASSYERATIPRHPLNSKPLPNAAATRPTPLSHSYLSITPQFFLNLLPLSNVINEKKAPQTWSSKTCAAEIPVGNSYGSSAARCDAD